MSETQDTSAVETTEAKLINAVTHGIVRTLQIHCSVDASSQQWVEKDFPKNSDKEYIIVFGVMGKEANASVNIEFSKAFLLDLAGSMLGERVSDLTSEIENEIQGLIGFIFRKVKRELGSEGTETSQLIPLVVKGKNLENRFLPNGKVVQVPIETSVGSFNVELAIGANA